jgi:CBS domain containing-hemolysin-like protein
VIAWNWIFLASTSLLLVLLNAIYVASEFSLIKLRYSHFNPDLLEELGKTKRFARLLHSVDQTLRFLRLGMTFSTLVLGMVLMPLVGFLTEVMGISGDGVWPGVLYCIAIFIAMGIHFILGELVPRAIAMQHPVEALRTTSWFIWVFQLIASPWLKLLDVFSKLLLRLLHLDPDVNLNQLNLEAQIRDLEEDSEIPDFTQRVFKNVISMRELVVQDVMLPRNQIQFFDINDGNEINVKLSKEAGHTRFPLCEGDLDNCMGIVHIKDIYSSDSTILQMDFKKMARPVVYVGADDHLESVLEQFLELQLHMALVRDDFGGTVGAITMENIVEELVGNIQDEFDSEVEQIEEIQEDVFIVDGLTPIHDVEEKLDMEIEEDKVSTIGGLITSELGRIPEAGQKIRLKHLEIEALEVDEKRVLSARVRVISDKEKDG